MKKVKKKLELRYLFFLMLKDKLEEKSKIRGKK